MTEKKKYSTSVFQHYSLETQLCVKPFYPTLYYSLISRGLFPNEHKGCRKGSRGTAELLYIDQHILNESKNWRKNQAISWIDYKKAYDMVPQSWIINYLKMYKISHKTINFIEKKNEKLESWINSGRKKLGWNKDPKRDFPRRCMHYHPYYS